MTDMLMYNINAPIYVAEKASAALGAALGSHPSHGHNQILLVQTLQEEDLARLETHPCAGLVEAQANPQNLERLRPLIGSNVVFFAYLSSLSLYQNNVGETFSRICIAHGVLHPDRFDGMSLSLHEAFSNAVLHGNLEVQSVQTRQLEDMVAFQNQIHERFQAPLYAFKPVIFVAKAFPTFLECSIFDQGSWDGRNRWPQRFRGLSLIRQLTDMSVYDPVQNALRMRFAYHDA